MMPCLKAAAETQKRKFPKVFFPFLLIPPFSFFSFQEPIRRLLLLLLPSFTSGPFSAVVFI